MLVPIIRYASRAICLFSLVVVIAATLEVLENAEVISKQQEGMLRVIFAGFLTTVLAILTARAPLSTTLRGVILCGLLLIMWSHFNSYTEHHPAWDRVPLLGKRSPSHKWMDPLLSGGWVLAIVYIAYRSVRSLHQLHAESLRQERLRAIGEMTSGIAHDLNNALTPLVGSAELLIASVPSPSERQKRLLNLLDKAAVDVSGIVDRVSHFRARGCTVQREVVSLQVLVDEAFDGLRPMLKAHAELDGTEVSLSSDLSDTFVEVCPTEIRVLLTNLLLNSIQVMPNGGRITVRNYYRGNDMLVDVTDTGAGMEREQLRRCVEPFFTTKSSGSGLGLPTCRQIVESYGSQLELQSVAGQGTTVTFGLPVARPLSRAARAKPEMSVPISVRKVLLVEDESEVRRTLRLMLAHLDVMVVEAANGEDAIRTFRRQAVDLVLTDFGLPDMTGADLIREIRMINQRIPMLVLSGWGTDSIHSRCDAASEPDQILKKPVSIGDLSRALSDFPHPSAQQARLGA